MTLAALVNGAAPADLERAVALDERGLHYGDGLFETALLVDGQVRFLDAHLERLTAGCERLSIPPPARETLLREIEQVTKGLKSAILKIIVTRGVGRGYEQPRDSTPTRIVAAYPAPERMEREIVVCFCKTRLARNAQLAGLKHLNRIEQVLARAELAGSGADEGLMLDTEGELVEAISANVFIVRDGVLLTPDLRFCGVQGVMRKQVLRAAAACGVATSEEPLWPHDLDAASEVFVTNAVRGVQSVRALGDRRWPAAPLASRLRDALGV